MANEFDTEMESFEFPCDPGSLPTTVELPLGEMILEAKSIKPDRTKENTDGSINPRTGQLKVGNKRMFIVQFTVDEPEDLRGTMYTHRFYVGTDSDPDASKPMTWKTNNNAALLMKMFKASKVGGKTFAEYCAALPGQKVGASIKLEKSKDPQYADKHVAKDFWEPGTKRVNVIDRDADLDAVLPSLPKAAPKEYERD